jgi:hypothetical protein
LLSTTTGSSRTALAGSCSAIGGTSTRPAPSRFRGDELVRLVARRLVVPVVVVVDGDEVAGRTAVGAVTTEVAAVDVDRELDVRVLTFMPLTVQ